MYSIRQWVASGFLALPFTFTIPPASAENWIAVGPEDSALWYDGQAVRTTSDRLIGVWLSRTPAHTQLGADGRTNYATYTLVDCKERKAGSKLSLGTGMPLQVYEPASSMGALIAKLCP